ncbi:hypothetical protein SUDANB105_00742 [Streptomyces sp. enrichment culture]|uniref:hypothetical protein n=1 Tax=Streptomyces sp. enrichment culture TaxID=1795815 RepID=UPI003F557EA4
MTRHLVDGVAVAWDELGTDLLEGAPPEIITALTGGEQWPSSTLDHLVTPDGSPPTRMSVTETTAAEQDLQWGYVLHPAGIEVINAFQAKAGPTVAWPAPAKITAPISAPTARTPRSAPARSTPPGARAARR